ncbi:ficolin-2 [Magallana gigas]|uniref:ficolin-2 n=1 Tax=Magallana gigas TaxID=29159 RepID=UPI003341F030
MVGSLASNSWNAVIFTTVLVCLVSLTEGATFAVVPGERYRGPVVGVVGMIGQQQCVRECRHRPKLCRGVNYRKQELLCELVSVINETEPKPGYVRIELDQTDHVPDECLSCSTDDLCVTLSSKKVHCIRDNGSPIDCTSLHNINCGLPSGLYRVRMPYLGHVTVFCDMDTDGGGWTVFQRRQDGSEDFYRTWTEYKNGFGNLSSEFWLGNEKLHNLLSQGTYEMRMDMEDFDNQTRYVKYSSFNVGNESSKYTVTLSGFSGDVGDCFGSTTSPNQMNNMKFTTLDQDNDLRSEVNCAIRTNAGWWHKSCSCANPNGLYLRGENSMGNQGVTYVTWRGPFYSMKATQMMVRRVS